MIMFQKGLKDVVAVHTTIASVDGGIGELRYRGMKVDDLIPHMTFEQLADFVWTGLQSRAKPSLDANETRQLPEHVEHIIDALPTDISIMDAMRTAVSAFAHSKFIEQSIEEQAVWLTASLPIIVARHYRTQNGLDRLTRIRGYPLQQIICG